MTTILKVHQRLASILLFFSATYASSVHKPFNFVLLTSIPKCGTHLLKKCAQMIDAHRKVVHIPGHFYLSANHRQLALVNEPFFLVGHALYAWENVDFMRAYKARAIFIVRDPRDQVVSMAYWIKADWQNKMSHWPLHLIIKHLIVDGDKYWRYQAQVFRSLGGITRFYSLFLGWMRENNCYVTFFEKLVGPAGGGDRALMEQEIRNIAQFMDVRINTRRIQYIADHLFGVRSPETFRAGIIGAWKTHFTDEHKKLFKEIAGQLLIDLGYEDDFEW